MRLAFVALSLLAACSDDPTGVRVIADISTTPPAYGRAPFPTDAVREGDHLGVIAGLDTVIRGHTDLVTAHLAALDGFGLRPVIEFPVDGDLDPASIPATSTDCSLAACVVGMDDASPDFAATIPFEWRYDADRHVVIGSPVPGNQLLEGTRYAAMLTTNVLASDGKPIVAMPRLPVNGSPDRWASTAAAIDKLDALDGKLAGIAVFTTMHASHTLYDAHEVLLASPKPTLAFDAATVFATPTRLQLLLGDAARFTSGDRSGQEHWGTDNPTGMAHDHIAVVATGHMTSPRFRGDDTGTDGPEDETFSLGPDGKPRIVATDSIPVTFVIPTGTPPPGGFPVVIFGHGLGGSRHGMLNLAEPLAAKGIAMVAIDMWGHGSRFEDVDSGNNLGGKSAFTGDKALKDGFGDETGVNGYVEFFESFLNVAAIRDAIGQSALDFCQLARLVRDPALDLTALGAAYTLDTTHLAYLGESFGTIVGTDVAAIEPSIGMYILDVPGGGLLDQILPNSAFIGTLAIPFMTSVYRPVGTVDRFHPVLSLVQAIFDGADPLTFAPHVLHDRAPGIGPRHVLAIEAVGDEIMANAGTIALARGLGLSLLDPSHDEPAGLPLIHAPAAANVDGQTGVLVQYAPATHGYNWSAEHGKLEYVPGFPHDGNDQFPKLDAPIDVDEPIYETMDQVTALLASYRTGTPTVILTKVPTR